MDPTLRALAAAQGGTFTRRQAVACGYTERQLKTCTRPGGVWAVLRRGVYAERALVSSLSEDDRYVLGAHAVAISTWTGAVISHTSAAAVHGLPLRPHWYALHHVTRPDVLGGRTDSGITHHRARLRSSDVVLVSGLRVTSPARTAVDIARLHGFEDGVVAADAALRAGASRDELTAALEHGRNWPHNTRARAAVRVADAGAQTIGESLLRLMVLELRIGVPETQYLVAEGGRVAYADMRVGRHLFEFDGRTKYVERAHGGVADRPVHQVLWEEKQREDWMRRAMGGHGVSRVVWSEMFGANRRRTPLRLRAEYDATVVRFGPAAA